MTEIDVTTTLRKVRRGESPAGELFPVVYDELRRLASGHLRGERPDHTLQTTALVHEAYLRLIDLRRIEWQDRAHFFGVASGAIRRILIDHARARGREKRGGGAVHVSLDDVLAISTSEPPGPELLELDRALDELALVHPEKARVVELRFFGGLTLPEIAEVLGVTRRTVDRYWLFARTWLYRELQSRLGGSEDVSDGSSEASSEGRGAGGPEAEGAGEGGGDGAGKGPETPGAEGSEGDLGTRS